MKASEYQRVKQLFAQALTMPSTEREHFLTISNESANCIIEVQQLLQLHHELSESLFLESPIATSANCETRLANTSIDGFVISRQIGHGSFGAVFEAQQLQPKRRVALKLLSPHSVISSRSIRRFEREAEILASLQHPAIVQIYATGTTNGKGDRQPWIAMEFVDGVPLNCATWLPTISIENKLRLLLTIAEAIQFAHGRGIIHRDIKPANILVTRDPTTSEVHPKILDFGLASFVNTDSTISNDSSLIGTIDYICPEAIERRDGTLDQRSDVYSLGVVAFEMLSGQLPFDRRAESIVESLQKVRSVEPLHLAQFDRRLRGDLDTIISTCLHRDPDQRFATVSHLCDDLHRYLNCQPITARPTTRLYRATRFLQRNWGAVTTATLVLMAALLAATINALEAGRAQRAERASAYEAEKATAIQSFFTNDFLFNVLTNPRLADHTANSEPTAIHTLQLVQQAASQVDEIFGDRPAIEAGVRNELGTLYYNLGHFEAAADEYRRAQGIWTQVWGEYHHDTLKSINNLGQASRALGRNDEAESLYRRAFEGRKTVLGTTNAETLASMNNLAEAIRRDSNRLAEAEQLFRSALELSIESLGQNDKITLTTMANLGSILIQMERLPEALELHEAVYTRGSQVFGADSIFACHAADRFAQTLNHAGQHERALSLLTSTVETYRRIFGDADQNTILARRLLARTYAHLHRQGEALAELECARTALQGHEAGRTLLEKVEKDIARINNSVARTTTK